MANDLPGGSYFLTYEEKQALRNLPLAKQQELEQLRQARIKKQGEHNRQLVAQKSSTQQDEEYQVYKEDPHLLSDINALMIWGPSGHGKSRLIGRYLCVENLKRGIGGVLFDPVGGSIANLLDKVRRDEPQLEDKIIYCNMAGERVHGDTYVIPWPLLERRYPDESLSDIAKGIVDLIAATDRNFANASIQGLPRLRPILTSIGVILGLFNLPITRAFDLLREPERWRGLLEEAKSNPEGYQAATHLEWELFDTELTPRQRRDWTEPTRNRLAMIQQDLILKGMLAAPRSVVNWDDVARTGTLVLLDFNNPYADDSHELRLYWVWHNLQKWIARRGASGSSHSPFAVMIDEISTFTTGVHVNTEVFVQKLQQFITARRRNANIQFVAATQEQHQLDINLRKVLLQIPSQLFGATSDVETAMELARRWDTVNPYHYKDASWIRYDANEGHPMKMGGKREYWYKLDRAVYKDVEEETYLNSLKYKKLEKGEWLFGAGYNDSPAKTLTPINTNTLDKNIYPDHSAVSEMKQRLMQRHGLPLSELLREIDKPVSLPKGRQQLPAVAEEQFPAPRNRKRSNFSPRERDSDFHPESSLYPDYPPIPDRELPPQEEPPRRRERSRESQPSQERLPEQQYESIKWRTAKPIQWRVLGASSQGASPGEDSPLPEHRPPEPGGRKPKPTGKNTPKSDGRKKRNQPPIEEDGKKSPPELPGHQRPR